MNQLTKKQRLVLEYFMTVVGTGLMAVSSVLFFDPCGMVPGGFTGIAIIVKEVSSHAVKGGVPLWLTNAILNIPLIPVTIRLKGWNFVKRTVAASVLYSLWLAVIPQVGNVVGEDLFLVSVFGGIMMGIGIALVFLAKATTGGTDLCGAILQHFFPHVSMPKLMQALDFVIMGVGVLIFGVRMTLYSLVTIYLTAHVSDRLMDGLRYSKMTYIISKRANEIAEKIMTDMNRGVTGLAGRGMYTNEEKTVLLCVVSPKEIVTIKELVYEIDKDAFVIVNDSREVVGEGFVQYS